MPVFIHFYRQSYMFNKNCPGLKSLKLIYLLFFIMLFKCVSAQINSDTLQSIYLNMAKSNFKAADKYLSDYERIHQNHPDALKLHAKVYFYMGNMKKADATYRKLFKLIGPNPELLCDYAEFLMQTVQYDKSLLQLQKVLKADPNYLRALLLKATVNYWKGDNVEAGTTVKKVISTDPNNERAKDLASQIKLAMAPRFTYEGYAFKDNQVIRGITHSVKMAAAQTAKYNPGMEFQMGQYSANGLLTSKYALKAFNDFVFPLLQLRITVMAGVFEHGNTNGYATDYLYGVDFRKQIVPHLDLDVYSERKPYTYNINSIGTAILQHENGVNLYYNKDLKTMIKGGYQVNYFSDKNYVECWYAWGLFPFLKNNNWKLQAGYGFNYSNSNESRYESVKSLASVLSTYVNGDFIQGRYTPYFTPLNQQIHSVLFAGEYIVSPKFKLGTTINYGVYAQSKIPYLYLENTGIGSVDFASGSSSMTFHPYDFTLKA